MQNGGIIFCIKKKRVLWPKNTALKRHILFAYMNYSVSLSINVFCSQRVAHSSEGRSARKKHTAHKNLS